MPFSKYAVKRKEPLPLPTTEVPSEKGRDTPTDSFFNSILMKTERLSRGSFAASSHPPSNGTNGRNGSNGTIERSVPYQPQFCERTIGKGAAARTATIVYQQLRYWSAKGQHQFEEEGVVKVWFYKRAEELAEELQMSVPTIRRALKRLVELGLLVVKQWWKHRYFRTNFFHLPHEPATIQRDAAATAAVKNKVVRGRRTPTAASTTVSPPANQAPPEASAVKTNAAAAERSAKAERNNRSDQNGTHIQKKSSIEEITYMLSQRLLWKNHKTSTERCSICAGTGTIEEFDGRVVAIHRCSCSAGDRYSHLPVAS